MPIKIRACVAPVALGLSILIFDLTTKAIFFSPDRGRLTSETFGIQIVNHEWVAAITVTVTAAFGWWAYRVLRQGRSAIYVVLVFSGALGNLFDRIVFGGVRDWIPFFSFSVMNGADIAIFVGIAGLLWNEVIAPGKMPAV